MGTAVSLANRKWLSLFSAPLLQQLLLRIVTGFIIPLFLPGEVLSTLLFPDGVVHHEGGRGYAE